MKRGILAAALACAPALAGAAGETLEDVLARHYAARGGLERIRSVQTVRLSGRMQLGPEMEVPFVLELKRPKKMRMDVTLPEGSGVQAFDGTSGWGVMPTAGPAEAQPLPAEAVREAEAQADMDGPLVDYRQKGHAVELLGKDRVDGAEAYKLKVTLRNGDTRLVWLDGKRLLEVAGEARRRSEEGEEVFETRLADYRAVDGLMVAHRFEAGPRGVPQRQQLVIEKVELNVPIDDARFRMPSKGPGPR